VKRQRHPSNFPLADRASRNDSVGRRPASVSVRQVILPYGRTSRRGARALKTRPRAAAYDLTIRFSKPKDICGRPGKRTPCRLRARRATACPPPAGCDTRSQPTARLADVFLSGAKPVLRWAESLRLRRRLCRGDGGGVAGGRIEAGVRHRWSIRGSDAAGTLTCWSSFTPIVQRLRQSCTLRIPSDRSEDGTD